MYLEERGVICTYSSQIFDDEDASIIFPSHSAMNGAS